MNVRHFYKWGVVSALVAIGLGVGLYKAVSAPPAPSPQPAAANAEEGVQVLTRGPVHEAFAETVTYNPEPGIVAPKTPPAAIEEVPPAQRPEGDNVAWIPGYWGWDDERNDFLWVSGVWRALPPGRQWVPGYWGKSAQGVQWTSGYWADAKANEVQYLPEPPASVEVGPSAAATSSDQTWLPGCWVWQNNRYAWRPGFWAAVQPDWVWIPAHYIWTPRGYVFSDGYWDYSVARRGVLFAPVYFSADVYGRRGFSYSPTAVIDLNVFANHLFLRPRYEHYYFGDYYAANYRGEGYYPWFSVNSGRYGYDPIFAHERWQHRGDSGWVQRQQMDFDNRRDHEDARPPRTWAGFGLRTARDATSNVGLPGVAGLLDNLGRRADSPVRFQPVNPAERQQFQQNAQDVQRLREQRQKLDAEGGAPAGTSPREFTPTRAPLPGSPIMVKPGVEVGKDRVPPKNYDAPKPDVSVEPKRRAIQTPEQPRTQSEPKAAERVAPQPRAVERPAAQSKAAERPAPQPSAPAGPPAGAKQDNPKENDKK
jgi:hypothetical protein